jgi:hypothetical protein
MRAREEYNGNGNASNGIKSAGASTGDILMRSGVAASATSEEDFEDGGSGAAETVAPLLGPGSGGTTGSLGRDRDGEIQQKIIWLYNYSLA